METIDWLDKCFTRAYVSQHYEDWDKRIFENYNVHDVIRVLDETDPEMLLITARTHNGKWFCNIGWGDMHAGLLEVDQLEECIQYFHRKQKPVVAYVSAVYDTEMYEQHSDWKQVTGEGKPVADADEKSWGKVVCLNSPYREYFIQMITSLVKTHDVDGVFFDMPFFDNEPCYCQYCQRQFYSRFGTYMPPKDWQNPNFKHVVRFRNDSNYTFIKDICDAVKRVNPKIAVGIQHRLMLSSDAGMTGQTLKAGSVPDYLYFDPYLSDGFMKASVCTRLISQVSKHMPEVSLVGRPGWHVDMPSMKPLEHLRMDAFTTIANGGAVQFFDVMTADGVLHEPMWRRFREVFQEVKQREPWLGGKHIKSVAIYYSENTRLWYGKENPQEKYDNCFFGWCRAMMEEHIPFLPICSLDKETLEGFQVLVLPNSVCLSKSEVDHIRDFVNNGGGLVSSQRTSLNDQDGNYIGNFGLSDVFGATYYGDTSAYDRLYCRYEKANAIAKRIPDDGLVNAWGISQKVVLNEGTIAAAKIVYPYTKETGKRFINIMVNPPAIESEFPACVQNTFGNGKSVYFTNSIGSNYLRLSQQELKWLMVDAIKAVSASPLKVQLVAPACVELTAYEQDSEKQCVVHLVNYQPENGRTIAYGAVETRHVIQETLPVYNLTLSIQVASEIEAIMLEPEGLELPYKYENGFVCVDIHELKNHTMVVLKYK